MILAAAGDRLGLFRYRGNDWREIDRRSFVVVQVIAGDTIEIEGPGRGRTVVRLLGIDAPSPGGSSDDSEADWGMRSREALAGRVAGRTVLLRLEAPQTRDGRRRVLAYVYADDRENVNLEMVRGGYAYADRRVGHSLRGQFELAENEARRRHRGFWAEIRESQMPVWRQQWLAERRRLRGAAILD